MKLRRAYFEDGSMVEQVATCRAFKRTVSNWRRLTSPGRCWFSYSAYLRFCGYGCDYEI